MGKKTWFSNIPLSCLMAGLTLGTIEYHKHPAYLTTQLIKAKNKICSLVDRREHWITVFIHGNFNTGLGFLNFRNIVQDSVEGTTYEKVSQSIRKDPFFYQEQPILEPGLVALNPSFLPPPQEGYRFAAHPIMSGYECIREHVKPRREVNHYYTFGWSGLWSKTIRQKEGLKFYHALYNEIKKLNQVGINPRIRVVAHSHGGNVTMSLAAINEAKKRMRNATAQAQNARPELSQEAEGYIQEYVTLLGKNNTPVALEKEVLDDGELHIDELIMLGTPIQAETSSLAYLETFKQVYSIYSDEDMVQVLDLVSTKKRVSERRFDMTCNKNKDAHVMQARIKIDRDIQQKQGPKKNDSWLGKISSAFEAKKEPTHKDLWFLGWNKEYTQEEYPFKPLPLVVFAQFLVDALSKTPENYDADINLRMEHDELKAFVSKFDDQKTLAMGSLDLKLVEEIKHKTSLWRPDNLSRANVFSRLQEGLK